MSHISSMTVSKYKEVGEIDELPMISWTINDNCQYRCEYCYVDLQVNERTSLGGVSKLVLNALRGLDGNFNIELLGGEPTMHPNYIEIINELIGLDTVRQLTVTSNIKKNMDFWEKHPKHKKIRIFVSQHPEYEDRDFEEKMIYIKGNFVVEGLLMLHQDIKYLDRTKKMADFMVENKIQFEPTMIFDSNRKMVKYDKEIMNIFENYKQSFGGIEYIDNNGKSEILSVNKIYQNDLHLLKGWNCSTKMYTIDIEGNISRPCKPGSKKHIMLFKKFDNSDIKCVSELGCMCDEWLRWKKWA